ncbi:MAG: carbonic anhydrase [Acidobacteriota bacterium]|nr:MAG: carbonic anhydrase [Acidobacteriota bacterium]
MSIEIVYRLDPETKPLRPSDAGEARRTLEKGNDRFASLASRGKTTDVREIISINPRALGISAIEGTPPKQTPFAAVLGCSDARVPVDLVFERAVNDLFVVRVAGNVLGNECLGSLEYALANLETIQLFIVLGHTSCGAVTTAVDAFLTPVQYPNMAVSQGLRSIVDRIFVSIRWASLVLEEVAGEGVRNNAHYRQALVETSVIMNAALAAMTLRQEIDREVAFGVYDLVSRRVRVPRACFEEDFALEVPPADPDELNELGRAIACSRFVTSILDGPA